MSSDDCYDCGKSLDDDNMVNVCRDCAAPFTEFVDLRKSKHAALQPPLQHDDASTENELDEFIAWCEEEARRRNHSIIALAMPCAIAIAAFVLGMLVAVRVFIHAN